MGFKPIMTGATSQRVNRFATATPVGTRSWSPNTELNGYLLADKIARRPLSHIHVLRGTGASCTMRFWTCKARRNARCPDLARRTGQ